MKDKFKILIILFCFTIIFSICGEVFAQPAIGAPPPKPPITKVIGSGPGSLTQTLVNVRNVIWGVAWFLAVIFIIYSGIMFITASGQPAKITNAKNALIWALVGIAVAVISRGVIYLVQNLLGASSTSPPSVEEPNEAPQQEQPEAPQQEQPEAPGDGGGGIQI
ncbi:MAG: hypothetical protein PHO31_03270 [Candidatus Pacebacteria bacterium]|nr:hypothetical protein [Candidatus Paceibacterota bacterium]